jgi:hypothetical protein
LHSRALPTVVRRAIAECTDQTKFDDKVLPSILHLIGTIFLNAGMPTQAISATRRTLGSVLQSARKASLERDDDQRGFADKISRYIVSRISNTVSDIRCRGGFDEDTDLICHLEEEIESLASSLMTGAENGIIELITKRDVTKSAAEKSSAVASVALGVSLRGDIQGTYLSIESDEISIDKDDILTSLIGEFGVETMKRNWAVHDELVSQIAEIETSDQFECVELESNLKAYVKEQQLVAERMEELKRAMRQLEEDNEELGEKIAKTKARVSRLRAGRVCELSNLSRKLEETKQKLLFETTLDGLAGGLKAYEESLNSAIAVSTAFEAYDSTADFVPSKINVYLERVKNYLNAEAECIEFLRGRVKSLKREGRDLVRTLMSRCLQI